MIALPLSIALAHLRARKRQSLVSILGVTLGVGVFVAVSGLMIGFQSTFRSQLIDSNPHIVMTDELRLPARQPLIGLYPDGVVQIDRILPRDPVRGIAGASAIVQELSSRPGVIATPVLRGQMILRRVGRDYAVGVQGIDPERQAQVTPLAKDIVAGDLAALTIRSDGIIIGVSLAAKMGASLGDTLTVGTRAGTGTPLRIVGLFRTGMEAQDNAVAYVSLARQQSLQARPRVVNEIQIRLVDIAQSIPLAKKLEGKWGYKTTPWEETFSRILEVFVLQNIIIYGSTGSILVVAAFGIFNIISTVVLEKSRDIAIMRAIGIRGGTLVAAFVLEGAAVGIIGVLGGWAIGSGIAFVLSFVPAPGATDPTQTLHVVQSTFNYGLAAAIALFSALFAAWLPARRAARGNPLDTIRGAA